MKKQIQILAIFLCLGIGAKGQTHNTNYTGNSQYYFSGNFTPTFHFDALSVGMFSNGGNMFIGGQGGYKGISWQLAEHVEGDPNFPSTIIETYRFTGTRKAASTTFTHWNQRWTMKFSTNTPSNGTVANLQTALAVMPLSGTLDPVTLEQDYIMQLRGVFHAKEIQIVGQINWADYVFADDYQLMSLPVLEAYIKENKHLPEVPSEKEVMENGISVTEMLQIHMKKIEELTLYIIQLQKELEELKNK